jgi:hypothetical protein
MWGALSDGSTGLSFTIAAGPRQRNHSRVRVELYCLRIETLPTWKPRSQYLYPPGTGWPSYTPRHWVPFSSPPTTRRAMMEVFGPRHGPQRKRLFHYCVFPRCRGNNLSTELFPSNGYCTVACLHSCYLTMGLHYHNKYNVKTLWPVSCFSGFGPL